VVFCFGSWQTIFGYENCIAKTKQAGQNTAGSTAEQAEVQPRGITVAIAMQSQQVAHHT